MNKSKNNSNQSLNKSAINFDDPKYNWHNDLDSAEDSAYEKPPSERPGAGRMGTYFDVNEYGKPDESLPKYPNSLIKIMAENLNKVSGYRKDKEKHNQVVEKIIFNLLPQIAHDYTAFGLSARSSLKSAVEKAFQDAENTVLDAIYYVRDFYQYYSTDNPVRQMIDDYVDYAVNIASNPGKIINNSRHVSSVVGYIKNEIKDESY